MDQQAPLTGRRRGDRRSRAAAALLGLAAALGPAPGFAQPKATLSKAEAALRAGKPADALALVADASSVEGLRLKVEAAARARKLDVALPAYQALRLKSNKDDPALLSVMATERLAEADTQADPFGMIATCGASVRPGKPAALPCLERVRAQATDARQPHALRVAAAAVLTRAGDKAGSRTLQELAAGTSESSRRAVIGAHAQLPPATAERLLIAALDDPDPGIQFTAAGALGDYPTDASRAALREYLQTPERRPGKGAARLSLAMLGDTDSLATVRAQLDQLGGGDLYVAALALQKHGDAAAVPALIRVAQGDHELLKLEAGAKLATAQPLLSRAVLDAAMDNPNPLTRAAALRAYAPTPLLMVPHLLAGLGDRDSGVAVQASGILLDRYAGAGKPAPAKKAPARAPRK